MSELDVLEKLLNRHQSMSPAMRDGLMQNLKESAVKVGNEMMAHEDAMSAKRDWLDTHRDDPRYEKRKAKFTETDVRLHARYGEALERYGEIIGERSFGRQDVGATVNSSVGAPVLPDSGEGAPRRVPGRSDQATDGVARTEPERSAPRQAGFDSLQARLRAERVGR